MLWSSYYGGSDYDGSRSILCDNANGSVYVVGYSSSPDMPVLDPMNGAYFLGTSGGSQRGFIWKFSQLGVRQWATHFGGSMPDAGTSIATDSTGKVYVCGRTLSPDFPPQGSARAPAR